MDIRREVLVFFVVLALLLGFVVLARSATGADQIVDASSAGGAPAVAPVLGGTSSMVCLVPPGVSAWSVILCDQYGFDYLPYWSVEVAGQEAAQLGITIEPIQSDFVAGQQYPVTESTSPRWRWTAEDNADNAKAFACYRLTSKTRPKIGEPDIQVILRRKWKVFGLPERMGRLAKTRELNVYLRAAEPENFGEWVEFLREKFKSD